MPTGPRIVALSLFDSIRPSSMQIAPLALQLVVAGRLTVTSPDPDEFASTVTATGTIHNDEPGPDPSVDPVQRSRHHHAKPPEPRHGRSTGARRPVFSPH